jgi:hypothetical protein
MTTTLPQYVWSSKASFRLIVGHPIESLSPIYDARAKRNVKLTLGEANQNELFMDTDEGMKGSIKFQATLKIARVEDDVTSVRCVARADEAWEGENRKRP